MADRRLLLKLSGEALCSAGGHGVDGARTLEMARQIQTGLASASTELALVVGGGNFLRGGQLEGPGIDRITADQMGMLATVLNALALRAALESLGVEARVLSAVAVEGIAEPYVVRRARRHLERGRVVLLAGGTGNAYFTTDTTAALRALQIGASRVSKGTKVRGVFSDDPNENPQARFLERLSFSEMLEQRLRVMDSAAVILCRDHQLPIQVFNMREPGNVERVLAGEMIGSMVE